MPILILNIGVPQTTTVYRLENAMRHFQVMPSCSRALHPISPCLGPPTAQRPGMYMLTSSPLTSLRSLPLMASPSCSSFRRVHCHCHISLRAPFDASSSISTLSHVSCIAASHSLAPLSANLIYAEVAKQAWRLVHLVQAT